MRKWLFRIVILLALLIGVGLLLFRTPDSDAAAMQAKYGGAQAHYVETDQARIHYRDVGPRDASVLLLVHGSNSWRTASVTDASSTVAAAAAADRGGEALLGAHRGGDKVELRRGRHRLDHRLASVGHSGLPGPGIG